MDTRVTEWSDAMFASLAAALALFFSAIPRIIAFGLIILVGWFVAALVEKGVAALLRAIHFNGLAQRAGLDDFVHKMGMNTDPAGMIALVVKWFVRLIALVVAFDALGLPAVSQVLHELLLWLPNVVVAIVVLVVGGLAAKALSNVVRGATAEAGLTNSGFLAKVTSFIVWTFTVVVAINQIGIANDLVNILFMAVMGALALGLGLAFGLGGRDTAADIVQRLYGKAQARSSQLVDAAGNVAAGVAGGTMAEPPAGGGLTGPAGPGYGPESP